MLTEILKKADLYADGLNKVAERRSHWIVKHKELKAHLKEIAAYLNANSKYKQGFFVDTLQAFNEEMNGVCKDMPSITFRSGDMPMLVTFKNSVGERKEYIEEGFRITFNPTITGEIAIMFLPHRSNLDKDPPEYTGVALIKDPAELTMDMASEIISKSMEAAYLSSFTGLSDLPEDTEPDALPVLRHHEPIGFKRYETTEKIK